MKATIVNFSQIEDRLDAAFYIERDKAKTVLANIERAGITDDQAKKVVMETIPFDLLKEALEPISRYNSGFNMKAAIATVNEYPKLSLALTRMRQAEYIAKERESLKQQQAQLDNMERELTEIATDV